MIGRLERLRTFLGAMGVFCLIFGLWVLFRVFFLGLILIVGGTLLIVVSRGPKKLAMDLFANSTPVEIETAKWPRQIIGATVIGVLITFLAPVVSHSHFIFTWLFFFIFVGVITIVGIWFGAWGVSASLLGTLIIPRIWVWLEHPWPILTYTHYLYIHPPAIILQTLLPAWAFRQFKGDPRIKKMNDLWLLLVFGMFLPGYLIPIISGFSTLAPLYFIFIMFSTGSASLPLLLIGSRIVIKARAYCRGWFS